MLWSIPITMMPRVNLGDLLSRAGPIIVPGVPNALFGRVAEELGFPAVFLTGAGFANMEFGVPDLGLTTMSEVVEQVGRLSDAVNIPVLADADTGYGNPLNVRRTVRELEKAGAAAIILEDQVFPKRCGHFEGKEIIPRGEMIAKVQAACDARRSAATVIIARTDARGVTSFADAIARANAYAAAGAGVTFVEAPLTREELAAIPPASPVPQLINVVEGGKTPVVPAAAYGEMGFKIVLYANSALRAALKGVYNVLSVLAAEGSTLSAAGAMVSWDERQRLVRLADYQALDRALEPRVVAGGAADDASR